MLMTMKKKREEKKNINREKEGYIKKNFTTWPFSYIFLFFFSPIFKAFLFAYRLFTCLLNFFPSFYFLSAALNSRFIYTLFHSFTRIAQEKNNKKKMWKSAFYKMSWNIVFIHVAKSYFISFCCILLLYLRSYFFFIFFSCQMEKEGTQKKIWKWIQFFYFLSSFFHDVIEFIFVLIKNNFLFILLLFILLYYYAIGKRRVKKRENWKI